MRSQREEGRLERIRIRIRIIRIIKERKKRKERKKEKETIIKDQIIRYKK